MIVNSAYLTNDNNNKITHITHNLAILKYLDEIQSNVKLHTNNKKALPIYQNEKFICYIKIKEKNNALDVIFYRVSPFKISKKNIYTMNEVKTLDIFAISANNYLHLSLNINNESILFKKICLDNMEITESNMFDEIDKEEIMDFIH